MTDTDVPTTDLSWLDEVTVTELEQNPYPVYERLRAESPVAFVPALGFHVATTKETCQEVAANPDIWDGVISPAGGRTFGHPNVLHANGPEHDELRGMVEPSLQPAEVSRYVEDLVRPIARRYVEAIEDKGHADLVAEFCEPVSVRSLGDLMGLRSVDSDTLRDWFHKLSVSFTNAAVLPDGSWANPDGFRPGDEARAEIRAVVDPLIDGWIAEPDDSALSHWLHDGMPDGQTRPREMLYPTIFVFLLGAMQEPGHAMSSTIAGLWTKPEQFEAVVDEPKKLLPRAIIESLRWTSPIWSAVARTNKVDTTVGGTFLPAGSVVMLSYGSANHDTNDYDAPSEYDLHRPPVPHLAFGAGNHACAGASFASEVCRIGLEELLEAIPNLERDPDREIDFWGWGFRGPVELHARWEV